MLKLPPLRQDAATPLWLQLKHVLRDHITFQLSPGARIPSEAALCRHYGLARMTVRQSITALVNEGLVGRQQGRGSFVLATRLAIPPSDDAHFLDDGFEATGGLSVRLVDRTIEAPPRWIRELLGLGETERSHKLRLTLSSGEEVLASRTIYVPEHVAPSLPDNELTEPVHRILEDRFGLMPVSAQETIRMIRADSLRAELLGIPEDKPLILLERVVMLAAGEPVEYARTYYPAEYYRFEHKLVRPNAKDTAQKAPNLRQHRITLTAGSDREEHDLNGVETGSRTTEPHTNASIR